LKAIVIQKWNKITNPNSKIEPYFQKYRKLVVSKKSCFFEHEEIKKPLQLPEILGLLKEQKGRVSLS
jgi:hypothetical protein